MKPAGAGRLRVVLVSFRQASECVSRLHRHHKPSLSHRFSLGVLDADGFLRGGATVGRPVAKAFNPSEVLEINRVATDGCPNACSALYGGARREGMRRGFKRFVTYTLASESGASLRAAGFRQVARVRAKRWSCPSRPRAAHPQLEKLRWEWP